MSLGLENINYGFSSMTYFEIEGLECVPEFQRHKFLYLFILLFYSNFYPSS